MVKGIDVSYAQGKVDWSKVKASGIEFAFIRIGYGREISQKDAQFENNYAGAKGAGIPIGGYHYSYATDTARARQEAQACLRMLDGKKFDLPIAYDMEESSQYALAPAELYAIYQAFASEITAAGYQCMLYTNLNWMKNKWSRTGTVGDGTKIWMAQYNSTMDYADKNAVHIWQYSSKGAVPGISGNVDMNHCLIALEELFEKQAGSKDEWLEKGGKRWYRHADGSYTRGDWEKIDGAWYCFDSEGWMRTGWIQDAGKWYYCATNGVMACDTILKIEHPEYGLEKYSFASDGHMEESNDRGALV